MSEMHIPQTQFAELTWRGDPLKLEYQWVGVKQSDYPVVVFLHEGLGSIALWKDFPERMCREYGLTGLVFSRYGYGQSTPRPHGERWQTSFMHEQAREVLPVFFASLGLERPWLFGHSDGGSITLLYAASFSQSVAGIVVVAPHILVEDVTIENIRKAREAYVSSDFAVKLKRYHADPESAFWGWNNVWLDPAFRAWNIEDVLPNIVCPVLAIQGESDEYGTLAQVQGIVRKVPQAHLTVMPNCGHSPHREQPEQVAQLAADFITRPHRSA